MTQAEHITLLIIEKGIKKRKIYHVNAQCMLVVSPCAQNHDDIKLSSQWLPTWATGYKANMKHRYDHMNKDRYG